MSSFNSLTYAPPPKIDVSKLPLLDIETLPKTVFWRVLSTAVTLRRDYGSATEGFFVAWLSNRLPVTLIDASGNILASSTSTTDNEHIDRDVSLDGYNGGTFYIQVYYGNAGNQYDLWWDDLVP